MTKMAWFVLSLMHDIFIAYVVFECARSLNKKLKVCVCVCVFPYGSDGSH